MIEFPCFRRWKFGVYSGLIVEFISKNVGITLYHPKGLNLGKKEKFREYTDEGWEPCADPRQSRTNRMLKALK